MNKRENLIIRISTKTKLNLKHISRAEDTPISALLRYQIAKFIDEFETKNGKIKESKRIPYYKSAEGKKYIGNMEVK
jgi:hypothetical protein